MEDPLQTVKIEEASPVACASAGDESAFEMLYDRYSGAVFAVARRMLDRGEAEEAVQKVFHRLWRYTADYDRGFGLFVMETEGPAPLYESFVLTAQAPGFGIPTERTILAWNR